MRHSTLSIALCTAAVCAQAEDGLRYAEAAAAAAAAERGGDWQAAIEALRRCLTIEDRDGGLWLRLGHALQQGGRGDDAVSALSRAIQLGAGDARSLQRRIARIHAAAGRHDQAVATLREAVRIGLPDRQGLFADAAFADLRDDAGFRELCARPPDGLDRDAGWRFDLRLLRTEIERLAPRDLWATRGGELSAEIDAVWAAVPDLSDGRIAAAMRGIVALLGDGRAAVLPRPGAAAAYPVQLYAFADGVFVLGGEGLDAHVGKQVRQLNGRAIEELMDEVVAITPRANPMGVMADGPRALADPLALEWLAVIAPGRPQLTLTLAAGSRDQQVAVAPPGAPAAAFDPRAAALAAWRRERPPVVEPPPYLRHLDRAGVLLPLPGLPALYLRVDRPGDGDLALALAAELRAAMGSAAPRAVVVDLRFAAADGDPDAVRPMADALDRFVAGRAGRRLFALVGRHTVGAAMRLSCALEAAGATFVGEPTGASPVFAGEPVAEFTLPHSGLSVRLSTALWHGGSPSDRRRWIAPQVPVRVTCAEFLAGGDPALEAVARLVGEADLAPVDALRAEVAACNRELERRLGAGDLAGVAAMYADDAVILGPRGTEASGRDELDRYWRRFADCRSWQLEVLDVRGDGRLLHQLGRSTLVRGDGRRSVVDFALTWRRQDDGTLRAVVDAYWQPR